MAQSTRTTVLTLPEPGPIEVWGGVECTCNRVGNDHIDQMDISGHSQRMGDFDKFADLGIRTLRVGLLWEKHVRDASWHRTDAMLQRLKDLRTRPIAGLLHHGSGPAHTDLLDPAFPEKLAAYALDVARRHPWIDAYTPVNEPNTTARFSGMYGIWYPHHRSRLSYLRALLGQLKGVPVCVGAMRTERADAQLIQAEDVGNITGTQELRHIWEQLNLRQWLTFDLLCGCVDRHHAMFAYMQAEGITEAEIFWFAENPCPPSVMGINYYITSDRYLDHRVGLYSETLRSAEGPFVDVEAVRVSPQGINGVAALLQTAWQRYRIPSAITEVHLGSSTDEQIRWMAESWEAVADSRRHGVQCLGITAWALLGSFYWNELVTRANGHYEPGLFDVRSGTPIPTELAAFVERLAKGGKPAHKALAQRGWWHHPDRFFSPRGSELAA